jgi:transposase-like protein
MTELTVEAKQKYLDTGGVKCPHCGHDDIEGSFIETGAGSASQKVMCVNCEKSWTDEYTLTGITEEE